MDYSLILSHGTTAASDTASAIPQYHHFAFSNTYVEWNLRKAKVKVPSAHTW